jgi:hypothetical protein
MSELFIKETIQFLSNGGFDTIIDQTTHNLVSQSDIQFYKQRIQYMVKTLLAPSGFASNVSTEQIPDSVQSAFTAFLKEAIESLKSTDAHDIYQSQYSDDMLFESSILKSSANSSTQNNKMDNNDIENEDMDVNTATLNMFNVNQLGSKSGTLDSFLSNSSNMVNDDDDDDEEYEPQFHQFPQSKVLNLRDTRLKIKGLPSTNKMGVNKNVGTIYTIYEASTNKNKKEIQNKNAKKEENQNQDKPQNKKTSEDQNQHQIEVKNQVNQTKKIICSEF